jgi:hypothetical protein
MGNAAGPQIAVADLLHAVLALDADDLDAVLDALAGSLRVEAAGWRIHRRRVGVERKAARNARIRALAIRLSAGQIAKLEGMTRGAVRMVLRRGRLAAGYVHATCALPTTNGVPRLNQETKRP